MILLKDDQTIESDYEGPNSQWLTRERITKVGMVFLVKVYIQINISHGRKYYNTVSAICHSQNSALKLYSVVDINTQNQYFN